MALLYANQAIFYHPCDSAAEKLQAHNWTGSGMFVSGMIVSGIAPAVLATSGAATAIDTDANARPATTMLSSGVPAVHLLAYVQAGLKVRAIRVSGSTITPGTEYLADASCGNDVNTIAITALTPSSALVAYGAGSPSRGTVKVLNIAPDLTVTSTSGTNFNLTGGGRHGQVRHIATDRVDDTHAVVVFADLNDTTGLECFVATASALPSGAPATGAIVQITPDVPYWSRLAVLTPSSFVVTYRDVTFTEGYSRVGSISGTTIAIDANLVPFTTFASMADRVMAGRIDDTHCVLLSPHDNGGIMRIAEASGSSLVWGPKTAMPPNMSPGGNTEDTDQCVVGMSPSSFVVAYYNALAANQCGKAFAATTSGLNISATGTPVIFEPIAGATGSIRCVSAAKLDSTRFLVGYRQGDTTQCSGICVVGTVASNNAITFGTRAGYAAKASGVSMDVLSSGSALVGYRDSNDSSKFKVALATIDGSNNITYGTPVVVGSGSTMAATYLNRTKIIALSDSRAILAYTNSLGSGVVVPAMVSGTTVTLGTPLMLDASQDVYAVGGDRLSASGALVTYVIATVAPPLYGTGKRCRVINWNVDDSLSLGPIGYGDSQRTSTLGLTTLKDLPVFKVASDGNIMFFTADSDGQEIGTSYKTIGRAGHVDGTGFTWGPVVSADVYAYPTQPYGLVRIGPEKVLICYSAAEFPNGNIVMHGMIGQVTPTGVVWGPRVWDVTNACGEIALCRSTMCNTGASGEVIGYLTYADTSVNYQQFRTIYSLGDRPSFTSRVQARTANGQTSISIQPADSGLVAYYGNNGNSGPISGATMTVTESGAYSSPSGSLYPNISGAEQIAFVAWVSRPSVANGFVAIERGYKLTINPTDIQLTNNNGSCGWAGTGITSLLNTLNDGNPHLLVVNCRYYPGTWLLRTSIDGAPYVAQGFDTSGGMLPASADTAPSITVSGSNPTGPRWIDEVAVWSGSTATTLFSSGDLRTLYNTGHRWGQPLDNPINPLVSGVISLYTKSFNRASGITPLLMKGAITVTGARPMYLHGLDSESGEMDLLLGGHETSSGEMGLFTVGPFGATGEMSLFAHGQDEISGAMPLGIFYPAFAIGERGLFLKVPEPISGIVPLFTRSFEESQSNLDLYMQGVIRSSGAMPLFMTGRYGNASLATPLFLWGMTQASGRMPLGMFDPAFAIGELPLFIEGSGMRIDFTVEDLLRMDNCWPRLIGKLDVVPPDEVYIEVWDCLTGDPLVLANSGCYPIGDTGRWGWSTQNLPPNDSVKPLYYYRMTGTGGKTFEGQFFMNFAYGRQSRGARTGRVIEF